MTATALPGGIQLKTTGDAAGWQVLCTWSTGEPRVMIGSVGKAAGAFSALESDGHRIAGPLPAGRWSIRGAAVAAIRVADVAVMSRYLHRRRPVTARTSLAPVPPGFGTKHTPEVLVGDRSRGRGPPHLVRGPDVAYPDAAGAGSP